MKAQTALFDARERDILGLGMGRSPEIARKIARIAYFRPSTLCVIDIY